MARHLQFYPNPVGAKRKWAPATAPLQPQTSVDYVKENEEDTYFFRALEIEKTIMNAQQVDAVRHGKGPARVTAGAGAGKTRVLIERVAYLISQRHIEPSRIMMLTFANKTATEMKERLALEPSIGEKAQQILCGTFHSIFLRLIRGRGFNQKVLSEQDAQEMIAQAIRRCRSSLKLEPAEIKEHIDAWKREGRNPEDMAERNKQEKEIKRVALSYEKEKQDTGSIDFNDIMLIAKNEIEADDALLAALQARIEFVLVDEFQDTSTIQFRILQLIVQGQENIFVVGDEDQSIYRYAGAGRFMQDFLKYYPGASEYRLTANYRSDPWIVELGNEIIAQNKNRTPKRMMATRAGIQSPMFLRPLHPAAEAEIISDHIMKRLERGEAPETIAILYRAQPAANMLLESLIAKNIPIQGDYLEPTLYDRQSVEPIMANIDFTVRPSWERIESVLSSLWVPKARAVEWLRTQHSGAPVLKELVNCPFLTIEEKQRILERDYLLKGASPGVLVANVIQAMTHPWMGRPLHRLAEDFAALQAAADKHETIEAFDHYVRGINDKRYRMLKEGAGGVYLMSIHRSKGLEFPVVYIVGASERIIPYYLAKSEEEIAEECRLLHVAVTRAQDELLISSPSSLWGQNTAISRFIQAVYQ